MSQQALVKQFFFPEAQQPVTGIRFKGREITLPSELEQLIGMTEGSVWERVRKDQMKPDGERFFVEGRDFDVISGDALANLKNALKEVTVPGTVTSPVNRYAGRLLVLYKTGVDMVCLRSDKPIAVKLCRFIVDEVFPMLRGGAVPGSAPGAAGMMNVEVKDELAKVRSELAMLRKDIKRKPARRQPAKRKTPVPRINGMRVVPGAKHWSETEVNLREHMRRFQKMSRVEAEQDLIVNSHLHAKRFQMIHDVNAKWQETHGKKPRKKKK